MSKSTVTTVSSYGKALQDQNDTSVVDLINDIDMFLQSLPQSHDLRCEYTTTSTRSSTTLFRKVSYLTLASDEESQMHTSKNNSFSVNDYPMNAKDESPLPFNCSLSRCYFSVSGATFVSNSEDEIANRKNKFTNQLQKQICKETIIPTKGYKIKKLDSSRNFTSFPNILYYLLEQADLNGFQHIVSWQSHGRAFRVHDQANVVALVMPCFFQQTRFPSFQRQLALYGFTRFSKKGKDYGAYYHENFLRGQSQLCNTLQRTPVKSGLFNRLPFPYTEPDFYAMATSGYSPEEPSPGTPLAKLFHIGNVMTVSRFNRESSLQHAQYLPNRESDN